MTLNGNKASIDVSETQYFKVETGVGENHTSRFQPIKFGIQLDITPWISQSGQITAEISPNVSNSDGNNEENYPNVSSRAITSTVRLNDGETLVLGGLIKNQESTSLRKIPVLGNLPFIGGLFRHNIRTRTKSNLVIFITPHIVSRGEKIDVEKSIEEYDIHDMNFIEKKIYKGSKKVKSFLNSDKKGNLSEDSDKDSTKGSSDTLSKAEAPVIEKSTPADSNVKIQPKSIKNSDILPRSKTTLTIDTTGNMGNK